MSTFNLLVPPLPLAPVLLRAINWAQPDDPQKKYPLLGRMRYAWLSDDMKNIKILLKDGPDSFSEEKPEIMDQIKNHENLVSVNALNRDPVYLVAEFNVPDDHYDEAFKELILDNFSSKMEKLQKRMPDQSFTKDPFDIFDDEMKKLQSGDQQTLDRLKPLMDGLMSAINGSGAGSIIKVGAGGIETQTVSEHLDEVVQKKKSVMKIAVEKENYERAAEIRDEIDDIKNIKKKE